MSTEVAEPHPTNRMYRPLTAAIPPEQSKKLDGAALVALAMEAEPETPSVEELPKIEKPADTEIPASEPEVQEEPEQEVEVKKEEPKDTKIETPLGEIEVPEIKSKKVDTKEVVEHSEEDDDAAWKNVEGSQSAQKKAFIGLRQKEKELKQIKPQLEELRRQLDEAKSRPAEVRPDPELATRYEALEAKYKDQEKQLEHFKKDAAVFRVEQSEEYVTRVKKPFEEDINPVIVDLQKATNGQINRQVFDTLALMDPVQYREEMRKLKEVLEPGDYAELSNTVPKWREVIKANTELKQNAEHKIALKQWEIEQQQQNWESEYKKEINHHLSQKDTELSKQFFGNLEDPELREWAANAVAQLGKKLDNFNIFKVGPEEHAALLAGAKNYPVITHIMSRQIATLQQQVSEKDKQIKELTAAQEKLTAASPKAGSTTGGERKEETKSEEFKGKLTSDWLIKNAE